MRTEKLDLRHIDALYAPLKESGVFISEYSFANLYLFRTAHDYEVVFDREIFIRGTTYDGARYLMPLRDPRAMNPDYLHGLPVRPISFSRYRRMASGFRPRTV